MKQEISIKYMVCDRCIRVVKKELEAAGFSVLEIRLGKALIVSQMDTIDIKIIKKLLVVNGFDLLVDRKIRRVEKIKTVVIDLIYEDRLEFLDRNLSDVIATKVGHDYSYLSKLFTSIENITIEKFVILQKIKRVKELLYCDELSLSQIGLQLGYSSVQHLSTQFKKVTGFTPTSYKSINEYQQTPIDKFSPTIA